MFGKKNSSVDKPKKDTIKISKKAFLVIFMIAIMGGFVGTALFVGVAALVVWDFVLHGKAPSFPNGSGSGSGSGSGNGGGSCTSNCGSGGGSGGINNGGTATITNPGAQGPITLNQLNATLGSSNFAVTITISQNINLNNPCVVVSDTTASTSWSNTQCPSSQNAGTYTFSMTASGVTFKSGDSYTISFKSQQGTATYNFHF